MFSIFNNVLNTDLLKALYNNACTYIHIRVRTKPKMIIGNRILDIDELLEAITPTTARRTDSATKKELTKSLKNVITLLRYCHILSTLSGVY